MKTYNITTDKIIELVSDSFDVDSQKIKYIKRKRLQTTPKQMGILLIRMFLPDKTLKQIGAIFNIHHSTVIYSVRTAENCIKTNIKYKKKFNRLVDEIKLKYLIPN